MAALILLLIPFRTLGPKFASIGMANGRVPEKPSNTDALLSKLLLIIIRISSLVRS